MPKFLDFDLPEGLTAEIIAAAEKRLAEEKEKQKAAVEVETQPEEK